jgi:hypothetical protein
VSPHQQLQLPGGFNGWGYFVTFAIIEPALAVVTLLEWNVSVDPPPSPSPSQHGAGFHPFFDPPKREDQVQL